MALKPSGIYVTLDVLLDTRFGTLVQLDAEKAQTALTSTYFTRNEDVFEGFDKAAFDAQYCLRDTETLKNSLMTGVMPLLHKFSRIIDEASINRPTHTCSQIDVNVHPYNLSLGEAQDITECVQHWVGHHIPVNIINVSPAELTPAYCRSRYELMFMYDYKTWLNAQADVMATERLQTLTLFVPALYFEHKPTDEELAEITRQAPHPFKAAEALLKFFINLHLIDVKYFSVIQPKTLEEIAALNQRSELMSAAS